VRSANRHSEGCIVPATVKHDGAMAGLNTEQRQKLMVRWEGRRLGFGCLPTAGSSSGEVQKGGAIGVGTTGMAWSIEVTWPHGCSVQAAA
jgi:hypothetical protein